jgi:hypothetical protein
MRISTSLRRLGSMTESVERGHLGVGEVEVVERIVKWVWFARLDDPQDGAGLLIALDSDLRRFDGRPCLGVYSEGVIYVFLRGVLDANCCCAAFGAAGSVVEFSGEAKAAVILGKSFVRIPSAIVSICSKLQRRKRERKEGGFGGRYQLAAMMGLPRMFFLLFGLRFTLGMLDLFFFFCNSRPILTASDSGAVCLRWKKVRVESF